MTWLSHLVAYGLLAGVLALIVWAINRVFGAREKAFVELFKRRGWSGKHDLVADTLHISAPRGKAMVTLDMNIARVKASVGFTGSRAVIRRLHDTQPPLGSYPGLMAAPHGSAVADAELEVFTPDGSSPAWFGPEVRAGVLSFSEPVSVTTEEKSLSVEIARPIRDATLLDRLVTLAAAIADPELARAARAELSSPVREMRSHAAHFLRLLLVTLALGLVVAWLVGYVPAVEEMQSWLLCGEHGPELDWKAYDSGGASSGVMPSQTLRGCGGEGEAVTNLAAYLLVWEALVLPGLLVAYVVAAARAR